MITVTYGDGRTATFQPDEARGIIDCASVRGRDPSIVSCVDGTSPTARTQAMRQLGATNVRTGAPVAATTIQRSIIGDLVGGIADRIIPGSGTIVRGIDRALTGGGDRAEPRDRGTRPIALPRLPGSRNGAATCDPPFVRDQSGICVFPGSPADRSTDPPAGATTQFARPTATPVRTLKCPRFANGKTGILWFSPMTNEVVCLPRGVSGSAWGLVRKNKPRKKAYITAAEKKQLDQISKVQKRAKEFAQDAGFKCTKK